MLKAGDKPDLLLTDVRMPGSLDGWQLAEAVRAEYPDIPVIYASGFSAVAPRRVPGSGFLYKPFHPSRPIQVATDLGVPPPRRNC